ncbi:MAG: ribbon-helix-helix domain-containing protein [Candidatus Delongbacteria bacterium]|nr:ribbon-helix-helix domain-containing protein [Candidatus Delongbacteria bacterium]
MDDMITIRIPKELKEELEQISISIHRPLSDLVRESLRKYVAVQKFRQVREMTVPYAEKQGIYTDDDILGSEK